jgi:hypothetical protein
MRGALMIITHFIKTTSWSSSLMKLHKKRITTTVTYTWWHLRATTHYLPTNQIDALKYLPKSTSRTAAITTRPLQAGHWLGLKYVNEPRRPLWDIASLSVYEYSTFTIFTNDEMKADWNWPLFPAYVFTRACWLAKEQVLPAPPHTSGDIVLPASAPMSKARLISALSMRVMAGLAAPGGGKCRNCPGVLGSLLQGCKTNTEIENGDEGH